MPSTPPLFPPTPSLTFLQQQQELKSSSQNPNNNNLPPRCYLRPCFKVLNSHFLKTPTTTIPSCLAYLRPCLGFAHVTSSRNPTTTTTTIFFRLVSPRLLVSADIFPLPQNSNKRRSSWLVLSALSFCRYFHFLKIPNSNRRPFLLFALVVLCPNFPLPEIKPTNNLSSFFLVFALCSRAPIFPLLCSKPQQQVSPLGSLRPSISAQISRKTPTTIFLLDFCPDLHSLKDPTTIFLLTFLRPRCFIVPNFPHFLQKKTQQQQ